MKIEICKMRKLIGGVGTILLVVSLGLAGGSVYAAEPVGDACSGGIAELVKLSGGNNCADVRQAAVQYAANSGKSFQTVVAEALGNARNTGDIFYSPITTAGVNHGHSGIYVSTSKAIETKLGMKATILPASNAKVLSGAVKQTVGTSQTNRNKAATLAKTFVGRAYNLKGFAFNKTSKGDMNCSQLVWVAYKDGTGIDLDSNGGTGVYPSDIKNSKLVSTYEKIR